MTEQGLAGKAALVTGASQGIGYACAARLAKSGCRVMMVARNADRLAKAADSVGDGAIHTACDVSDAGQVEAAVAETVERLGGVDILVNAHGVLPAPRSFFDLDDGVWDEVLGINFRGLINTGRAGGRRMRDAGGGVIVNVSSINALLAEPEMAPYNVAKGALASLTRSMAYDGGPHGIRVVGIEPGWVRTPMAEEWLAPLEGDWLECSMLGRFGHPDEIARVVEFVAGQGGSYITGTMVTVDGGHAGILPILRAAEPAT